MKNKKENYKKILGAIVLGLILIFAIYSIMFFSNDDEGEYNYCVSWEGMGGGTLHRDNLLYTCYNLATNTFYCDYEIQNDGSLMVKPITNITKNEEGFITEIVYDKANFFNCTRWLKSRI